MPLPVRPQLEGARAFRATPHVLTEAERTALNVIAEHVRDRVQLQQVWIFAQASAGIEDVARASSGEQEIPDAAARVIALAALREGERRRVRYESGVHLVSTATSGGRRVTVIASGRGAPLPSAAQTALAELADVAARVLADDPVDHPRAVPEEPDSRRAPAPLRAGAYGAGLAEALALLRRPPILAESRERAVHELGQRHPAIGAAIHTVETDLGLALAVMTAANALQKRPREGFASVPEAIRALGPRAVIRLAQELPTLGPNGGDRLGTAFARLAGHALATRAAAEVLARQVGDPKADELRLAALLHDVGKIVLAAASPEYFATLSNLVVAPEQRIADERRRLGIDHAAIGAVAVKRLGLPKVIATTIERHHADDASGPAAVVRLADMVAHQAYGAAVAQPALTAAAKRLRIDAAEVQRMAYDLTRAREAHEPSLEPSPLTPMQHKALMGLAQGKTYKQIAADLSVSESTVRTHLHNLYGKLGVADRAQAVLLAAGRGWI